MDFKKGLILLLIFATAFFLRIYKMSSQSLWIDEATTWYRATHFSPSLLYKDSIKHGQFPFYFLFMKYWIRVFGNSEFSLRFPSFLFSLASLPFFYKILKIFFKDYFLYFGFLIFSLAPFNLDFAQEARMYAFQEFFFLVVFYYLFLGLKERFKRRYIIFYSLALIFLIISGIQSLLAYLSILIFSIFLLFKDKRKYKIFFISFLLFLPVLPFLIEILKKSNYLQIALYHFKIEYNFKTQIFFLLGWFIRVFKNFSFFFLVSSCSYK